MVVSILTGFKGALIILINETANLNWIITFNYTYVSPNKTFKTYNVWDHDITMWKIWTTARNLHTDFMVLMTFWKIWSEHTIGFVSQCYSKVWNQIMNL